MPIRIYALAKELQIDNKKLVDICTRAGITGKGSALASLTDEEVARLKTYMAGGRGKADGAAAKTASPGPGRSIRREDYIAPAGTVGTKVPVLPPRQDKPPLLRKKAEETAPPASPAIDVPPVTVPAVPAEPVVHAEPAVRAESVGPAEPIMHVGPTVPVELPPVAPPPVVLPTVVPLPAAAAASVPAPAKAAAAEKEKKPPAKPVAPAEPVSPSSSPFFIGPVPSTRKSVSAMSRPLERLLGNRESKPGEKKSGEKRSAEKISPAMHLAPMPAPSKTTAKSKPKEPTPQKPDLKLPPDAIRAGKAGSKPLSEHLRKHEEKKKRDDLAAKKGLSRARGTGTGEGAVLPRTPPGKNVPGVGVSNRPSPRKKGAWPLWAAASSGKPSASDRPRSSGAGPTERKIRRVPPRGELISVALAPTRPRPARGKLSWSCLALSVPSPKPPEFPPVRSWAS